VACLFGGGAVTTSLGMSAPQLTDPGASGEWFRTLAEESRPAAAARRQRFVRLVKFAMIGCTAFTLLGLGCFAWRRHTLQAALEAPLPASSFEQAVVAPVLPEPAGVPLVEEPATPTAPWVSDAPSAAAAAPPSPVNSVRALSKVAAKPSKKAPRSPFLGKNKLQAVPATRR
jgi:hypothetical protein